MKRGTGRYTIDLEWGAETGPIKIVVYKDGGVRLTAPERASGFALFPSSDPTTFATTQRTNRPAGSSSVARNHKSSSCAPSRESGTGITRGLDIPRNA
ncbi:hypothetical protein [Sorangium sp. So ce1078]|uniref:hypothetical protein n=1 Tax=Sorangium sp. So ce1078 TaxID=3133329 RepID=UPI003F62A79A